MRKMLFILSLAGLALLASTDDGFARGRSGGGSGGRGSSSAGRGSVGRGNVGRGYGGGGYGGGGYYGGGYGGGGYLGGGYLGGGLLGGLGYYGGGGYGYAPSYYDGTPGYSYYSDPAPLLPATQVRQSYYPVAVQDFVNVTVLVPTADAQVWFENKVTTQQGMQRLFESPALTPNHSYTYTIKARWMETGKTVNEQRQVSVRAGQNVTVNFRANAHEDVAAPLPTTILQK